uniref:LRRCT domain-containing protein n=1 Tax=Salarias fasciatus TaxID=181472 RepID=A0A672G985_SALFA
QPSAPRLPGKEPPCRTSPLKAESRQTGFPCLQELLNLRFLMLGQNQIGTLRPEMFSGMRNLSDLDLPLNALTLLPSDAFKPLIALKVLDLAESHPEDLPEGLRRVDLPLNALTLLPSNAFKPLIALKVLDLSLNCIQKISPKAFAGLRQLLFLNLDNNRWQKLASSRLCWFWTTTSSLRRALQELYVRNNQLELLPADMPGLKKLDLHNNPWHCDCQLASLVQWMGRTAATLSPRDAVKCVSPPQLRRRSLGGLQEDALVC